MKFDTEEGPIHFLTNIPRELSVRISETIERKWGSIINEIANAHGGYLAQEVPHKNDTTFVYFFSDGFSPRITQDRIIEWIRASQ